MRANKLIVTLASSVLFAGGVLTSVEINNPATQVVEAARKAKSYKLTHNAAVYNRKGRRVGKTILKKNRYVKTYGVVKIKGQRYYNLGRGKYVKVANFAKVVAKKKATKKVSYKLTKIKEEDYIALRKARVYNSQGKATKATVARKSHMSVYGFATIGKGKYLYLGKGRYLKVSDAKPSLTRSANPLNTKGNNTKSTTSSSSKTSSPVSHTSSSSKTSSQSSTSKTTTSKSSSQTSKSSSSQSSSKPAQQSTSEYNVVDASGTRNYLTNNVEHVKQLALEKINAIRANTPSELGDNFKLMPYKTNSEIQAMADMRAKEATIRPSHTRPNGEFMSGDEFQKLLPNTDAKWHGATGAFGENLGAIWAQKTDEETADAIVSQFMSDPQHKAVLLGADAPYAYAAFGLYFDPMKGYCTSFEMIGSTRPPFEGNDWAN